MFFNNYSGGPLQRFCFQNFMRNLCDQLFRLTQAIHSIGARITVRYWLMG